MTHRRIVGVTALAVAAAGLGCAAWWSFTTAGTGTAGAGTVDVLVVFGSPAEIDGSATAMQMWRVREGVAEYRRGQAAHLIFIGGPTANRFVEADVMARAAIELGVPSDAIFTERDSKTTIDNMRGVTAMMKAHGWTLAELISSADHLPRIAVIARPAPFLWRLHAAPTPGRGRLTTAWSTMEESVAILMLRTFGSAAEPIVHVIAVCEHWVFFAPKWVLAKLRHLRK